MVSLFGKKKKPAEELPPAEFEDEPSLKDQVGYEEEPPEEPPEGSENLDYPLPEGEKFEGAPPGDDFPPFLPRPGSREEAALAGETYTKDDVEKIAREVADEVRKEFEEKLKSLNKEVDDLKKLDEEIQKMYNTFDKLNEKYSELEERISDLPTQTQEDLKDIKSTVNSINQIMSTALPALIKEVRDLKTHKK